MTERGPLLATTHQCTHGSTAQQRLLTIAELELVEVQSPQDLAPCLWLNEGHVSTHQGTDVTGRGGRSERESREARRKEQLEVSLYMNTAYPDTLNLVT